MRLIELLSEAKATKTRLDPKCWKGKKIGNPKTKVKGGVRVNNCVPKESIKEGDVFFIEAGNTLIETTVVYESNGRIIIDLDDAALKIIESAGHIDEISAKKLRDAEAAATAAAAKAGSIPGTDDEIKNYDAVKTRRLAQAEKFRKAARHREHAAKLATVASPAMLRKLGIKEDANLEEAKYHGKEVPLGKRLPGDVKKSKVYVRKPNGKIVKVNFGDKKMRIKKSNPKRRKSFRARHNCKNPGPRWKARYWSCRAW